MAKTRNNGTADKAGAGNPPNNLKNIAKQKDISAKMIIRALKRMPQKEHKDGIGGHSLAAIRSYLQEEHLLGMSKERQELVKEVIRTQFSRGLIDMTNFNGPLNFTKRFAVAADVEESELDSEDAMSSDENEE